MKKNMVRVMPMGSCLNCGGEQFIVAATSMDLFLTNKYGEVIDSREVYDRYKGRCCTCGAVYDMLNISNGFVPLTPLRKLLYKDNLVTELPEYTDSPMEKNNEN